MSKLTSRNRKLVYMGGIILLLIPIGVLGMPAKQRALPNETLQDGGEIARLRHKYKLGETTLGDVDPASATMNLVLLGMRGIAGSVLWIQADKEKQMKNWSELEQTVESIIKLQPRFLQVWKYQGWNLAFNVSAECDAVEDRYFWVKKGAKFLMRGTEQNVDAAELYHDTGTFFGKKIGRSDEHVQFRRFFKSDPDPRWNGRPDEEINPDGKDNYVVSREYYEVANDKEELPGVEQHLMARILFRSYPGRSQFDYAAALQSEQIFDEVSREAWREGHRWWTQEYGQELFSTTGGGDIILDATLEDLERLAENDPDHDINDKREWLDRYQKMTNYPYWKNRSEVESKASMVDARRKLVEGKAEFFESHIETARDLLESGLKEMEVVLKDYPEMLLHSETVEDILKSHLMWQFTLRLLGEPVPQDFPLRQVWDDHPMERVELEEQFQNRLGLEQIGE